MKNETLSTLRKQLDEQSITSVELTQSYLDAIEQKNTEYNCYITVCHDHALRQAAVADQMIKQGLAQPLTGIPYAHKDIFCTRQVLTTAGSKMLHNFVPPYDATVSEKLNAQGAVLLGKTNMDEFAMGSSNENSYYGSVKNPWNSDTVPGGSSGGSAAAVAAGLAPIATGTDTGGSIRQPAAFCGLTGIKPTYGRVSRFGMIAFASSLDQGGVFANNAQDAATMLEVISGHDLKDSTSAPQAVPTFSALLDKPLAGLRVGLPRAFFETDIDTCVREHLEQAIALFKSQGATLVDIELPHFELSIPTYYVIAPAEASSNLSRYDGIRFGYRAEDVDDLHELYEKTRSEGFGDEVKRRILLGTFALSAGYYDAYYLKAQKVRRLIKNDFDEAFKSVDIILAPSTPTSAFGLGEKHSDPVTMYLSDIFTIGASLAGLPAASIPVGFDSGSLPIGMQIIGNYFDEAGVLAAAHQYQQHTDWHLRRAFD